MSDGRPTPAGRARPTPGGRSRPTPAATPPAAGSGAATVGALGRSSARCRSCRRSRRSRWSRRRRSPGSSRRTGAATQTVVAAPRNVGDVPDRCRRARRRYVSPNRIEIPGDQRGGADRRRRHAARTRTGDPARTRRSSAGGSGGAKPGARKGTAILAGHINYAGVDGVLREDRLARPGRRGLRVRQRAAARSRLTFQITGVRTYNKTRCRTSRSSTRAASAGWPSSPAAARSTPRPATTSTTSSPSPCPRAPRSAR